MQQRTNEQSALQGIMANSMETTTDALGNIVPTGRIDPSLFEQKLNQAVATGGIRQATADAFKGKLFPASPTTAQPQGMATPLSPAQTFAGQLSQMNQRFQPIAVPFAAGNAPAMETASSVTPVQNAEVVAQPASAVARPLTQEEKRQMTLNYLNDWQNGGADRYWAEQRAQALANSKAQAQAIGQVMQQNQPTYPFWLK
nr:hypothetical protein [uncultured Haemophilus sp.]